jgi:hypothetical protein
MDHIFSLYRDLGILDTGHTTGGSLVGSEKSEKMYSQRLSVRYEKK